MSDDFIVEERLEVQRCYVCGIVFAVPARFIKNRREDSATFYCPNMHKLCYPKRDSNGETEEDKLSRLEEETAALKLKNVQLLAKLDQAEAKLEENASSQFSSETSVPETLQDISQNDFQENKEPDEDSNV